MTSIQKIPTYDVTNKVTGSVTHDLTNSIEPHASLHHTHSNNPQYLKQWIREQALDLGFADCGFISVHNPLFKKQMQHLRNWLEKGYEGSLSFLHNNHDLRENPANMVEGTKTIISVRMDYLTEIPQRRTVADNNRPNNAIIARYARGRDYHKTMRGRLKKLAKRIEEKLTAENLLDNEDQPFVYRPFADSAPIFERAIADAAGLGWTGKHTLLINRQGGSFFVLGELFMSLEMPEDTSVSAHCGKCTACIDICPTSAIVAPYELNASACISYLTIEHKGSIPLKYRKAIGNRIFGCDDCQLICPWNGYAKVTSVEDFSPRNGLDNVGLLDLWQWSEDDFNNNTQGSPIRRTGYESFLRNIAIGIGNMALSHEDRIHTGHTKNLKKSKKQLKVIKPLPVPDNSDNPSNQELIALLTTRLEKHSDVVDEHINWAIEQLSLQGSTDQ